MREFFLYFKDLPIIFQMMIAMMLLPFLSMFLMLVQIIFAPWIRRPDLRARGLFLLYGFPPLASLLLYLFIRENEMFKRVSAWWRDVMSPGGDPPPAPDHGFVSWAEMTNMPWFFPVLAGTGAFFLFTFCAMVFLQSKNKGNKKVNYLVLLRHGQSQWNLENRFTGFHDIDLSDLGREEAAGAGKRLKSLGVKFDAVYTSTLKRAYNTAQIALENAGQADLIPKIIRHDDLRERDYGDLTGLNKDETRAKYGEEQVHIWRRSYDVCPPGGECLQDVVEKRVRPYFAANIKAQLEAGKNILVAAHGNSLRALLIILGAETPETINKAEMETGVPVVFEMDGAKILKRYSLTDEKSAA